MLLDVEKVEIVKRVKAALAKILTPLTFSTFLTA